MEDYIDTKVIERRRKQDQAEYNRIETGVYVNNRLIEFETQELFDKKMSIALPKGMTPMPEDMAKIKYTTEHRPKIIYTNQEGTVNFTFNHFTLPIQEEETIKAAEQMKNLFKKVHPANIFYEELAGMPLGTRALDETILFNDFLQNIALQEQSDYAILSGKLESGSTLLDTEIKSRSFQDVSMADQDIIEKVLEYTPDAGAVFAAGIFAETEYRQTENEKFYDMGAEDADWRKGDYYHAAVDSIEDYQIDDTTTFEEKSLVLCEKSAMYHKQKYLHPSTLDFNGVSGMLFLTDTLGTAAQNGLKMKFIASQQVEINAPDVTLSANLQLNMKQEAD